MQAGANASVAASKYRNTRRASCTESCPPSASLAASSPRSLEGVRRCFSTKDDYNGCADSYGRSAFVARIATLTVSIGVAGMSKRAVEDKRGSKEGGLFSGSKMKVCGGASRVNIVLLGEIATDGHTICPPIRRLAPDKRQLSMQVVAAVEIMQIAFFRIVTRGSIHLFAAG